MQVELWPIDRPVPYSKNPRKLTEKAISKVAASIKQFGFQQPIVVDSKGVVIVGHTRLQGAQKLGLKQVPVAIADNLTPAQVKAYRIADNRVAQETSWLDDVLSEELLELKVLDFDLGETGFDMPELDRLMRDNEELERAEETPPVPETPVSMMGDLWILGPHRLLCGDSTVATDVERVLGGVKPHLLVSDPPYGVVYDANWRNEAERANGRPVGARATGKVLNDDKADWRETWALFPGDVAYIWHAGVHAGSVQQSLEVCGFTIRSQIIWAKNNIAIGRGDYHWQHEPAFYAVRTKAKGHWNGDRKQSTLWKIDKPQKSETGHSTQKPVECMLRPIQNNSSTGQAIYEPFSGSGTTIIAAEMSGRSCHAIELNPAYVDVGVLRWQEFAGQEAIHADTGKTFAAMKAERVTSPSTTPGASSVELKAAKPQHVAPKSGGKRQTSDKAKLHRN